MNLFMNKISIPIKYQKKINYHNIILPDKNKSKSKCQINNYPDLIHKLQTDKANHQQV